MNRPASAVRLLCIIAALLTWFAAPRAALAAPHGSFVALPSSGLPAGGDVSQVAVNANGELFATVYGQGVYRSIDGGSSFVKLAPPNLGMTNDIPNKEMMTMIVNALGEPIIGCREVGAQQGQYLFRLDWASRTWVAASIPAGKDLSNDGYDATGSQTITLNGVAIPKQRRFPRHLTLDPSGTIWLGWSYIGGVLRSFDNGNTYQYAAVPSATQGTLAGTGPGNVYSFNVNPRTGEYFYGTELIGFWHSTDGGNTWLPLDPTGTTIIGSHQNDYSIGFNKNQEPIFSNWGRSAANPSGGDVFTILTRYGTEASASMGLRNFQFNRQNVFYQFNGGDAIVRNLRVESVGYNFISAYSGNYYGDPAVPDGGKQTVYLSTDGFTWAEADVDQPFISPYCNALCTDGTDVFVGGVGQVWKFVITVDNHLPVVTITPPASINVGAALAIAGAATDADADPVTYAWFARGPGHALFQTPSSAATLVAFDVPGDYVITLTADDGHRSASASAIVHVLNHAPTVATPAAATYIAPTYVDLTVLGDDLTTEGGEPGLTYSWEMTTGPAGAVVSFDVAGNNAAKVTRATVTKAGNYTFRVTITDSGGLSVTSSASTSVNQGIASITLSPADSLIANDAVLQLGAQARDQFGVLLAPQPTFTWSVSGGGTISSTGQFVSDGVSIGTFLVTATSGPIAQSTTVELVRNDAPIIVAGPTASPATVTLPGTTSLSITASDPDGVPGLGLTITWRKISGNGVVTFTPSATTSAVTQAAFSAAGVYVLGVDVSDGISTTAANLTIVVDPDPTIPITVSFQDGADGYSGEVDLSITTQSQAAYNGMNGNTFRTSTLYAQDTTSTGGFTGEGLLRFDNLALPPGAKVLSATLTLNVSTYSAGYALTGRYLATSFNQAAPQYKIGWINRDSGLLWNTPGARGEGTDLVAGTSFSLTGFSSGMNQARTVTLDPTIVRGWITNPGSNHGIMIHSNAGTSGTISSAFETSIGKHPKLTLVYESAIAQTATATPAIVLGNTTALHVLGTSFPDEGGEPSLTYTWSVAAGSPAAPVLFSQNGTNAAKDTVATFSKVGSYGLRVTITDAAGVSVVTGVDVLVGATPSLVTISPTNATTAATQALAFSAAVIDQFGATIMPPPTVTWSVNGGGVIDAAGVFTPDGITTGLFEVSARTDGQSSSTYVTVLQNSAPLITSIAAAPSSLALPSGTTVTAIASDPDGFPGTGLVYDWSLGSGPAPVIFTPNHSAAAASAAATFTAPGTYTLHVDVTDGLSTAREDVVVTVAPDPATPIVVSFQQGANGYTGGVDVSITTQSRAAYNGQNGNLFRTAQVYVQDTSSAPSGFIGKGLIRFNQLGIPANAVVTNAALTVTFSTYSPSYAAVGRYLLASWDPAAPQYKLGWVNRDATHLWAVQGAAGEGTDLVANKSFTIATATTGGNQVRTVNLDTGVVQSWVANPSNDQGVILSTTPGLSAQFSGATDPTIAKRPRLVITYHL